MIYTALKRTLRVRIFLQGGFLCREETSVKFSTRLIEFPSMMMALSLSATAVLLQEAISNVLQVTAA